MTPTTASLACAAAALLTAAGHAQDLPDGLAVHAQATVVEQANAAFHSPYRGANSLNPAAQGRETADATLMVGLKPWRGGELWADTEVDQGFGLSNTLGVAGYPSGEAYKVGASTPYLQLHRLFLRQTLDLGASDQAVEADQNQFSSRQSARRIVVTAGKFAVTDVFDNNRYAHDARNDFLNWAVIDSSAFDYAANAWGYSIGAAAELYWDDWTLRTGLFDLSDTPNSERLDKHFAQDQLVAELEHRFTLNGRPGAWRVTAFQSSARMGRFADALALASTSGDTPDTALVRRRTHRDGAAFNVEQQLADDLGIFLRLSAADPHVEAYDFSDIDRSVAGGVSIGGARWGRPADTLGAAVDVNVIGRVHQDYLRAGGLGILVGDGRLRPGPEQILESYYSRALSRALKLTLDGQWIRNPAYNRDRGPATVVAVRLHAEL